VERQYVAIDLHKKRSLIVRDNAAGEELAVVRIDNDPETLSAVLAEAGPEPEVAIEAAYGWYWAVDLLQEAGAHVHLVHPAGLNWEDRRVKNDYLDCRELLDRMHLGKLPEAWISPHDVRELRELVRYRGKLVAQRTSAKAQVKAVLAKHGLHPPVEDLWGPGGTRYLDELRLEESYTMKVQSLARSPWCHPIAPGARRTRARDRPRGTRRPTADTEPEYGASRGGSREGHGPERPAHRRDPIFGHYGMWSMVLEFPRED
jgi:hypothetical protein